MSRKPPTPEFTLNPRELRRSGSETRIGGSASAKVSRSAATRTATIVIEHLPTALTVEGSIPEGNYTRNQFRNARMNLEKTLIADLTKKVAKRLRLPGR